ncbi:MAG: hypothetical protein RIS94_3389 [Pseudomonadota bacterium]|jgi:hypothetical protein
MDKISQHGAFRRLGWLHWQAAIVAVAFAITALAPAPGAAVLYLPLAGHVRGGALDWALHHGGALAGVGPGGGVLMMNVQTGFGWRALREGALAIRVPQSMCRNAG